MAKQKMFIKVSDTALPLYNGLQSMLKTTKRNGIASTRIEDGYLDITEEDIDFLKRNNYHSMFPVSGFINSITLFTKKAKFYDNIPIKYSFSDEDTDNNSAYVYKENLYIVLPLQEAEEADPDSDIIDYILKNLPISDEIKYSINKEFKRAVYAYEYENNRQAILDFYRLIEMIVPIDTIKVVTYVVKQAFNLYLFQKNMRNKSYKSHKSLLLDDVKLHVDEIDTDSEDDYPSDYGEEL